MRVSDAMVSGSDLTVAAESAALAAWQGLEGAAPSLALVMVAGGTPEAAASALEAATEACAAATVIGCSVPDGVVGRGQAVGGGRPAASVWMAALDGVRVRSFHLEVLPGLDGVLVMGTPPASERDDLAILLADPFSFPVDGFVSGVNDTLAGLPLIGGLPCGPAGPGSSRLMVDGRVVARGAVGVTLGGGVTHQHLVCPGARPVGPPMTVTATEGSAVLGLAGAPALAKLQEVLSDLVQGDQALASTGAAIGILADEYSDPDRSRDYVVSSIVGIDVDRSELALSAPVELGCTVRVHVIDHEAAATELDRRLREMRRVTGRVAGALLFCAGGPGSSSGRTAFGTGEVAAAVRSALGVGALSGFTSQGVIAPLAGRNHVHGVTAAVLAFPG